MASDIKNAYIDFSKMTTSIVAVVTDVIRDGKPIVGFGFNSNGVPAPASGRRHAHTYDSAAATGIASGLTHACAAAASGGGRALRCQRDPAGAVHPPAA